MTHGQKVAESIERAVSGPVWHGPALMDLVGDVTAEQAAAYPVAGAHSIWELVLHITAWAEIVRARLLSNVPVGATPDQDWPRVREPSAEGWRGAVERMKEAHRELSADVDPLEESRLVARVPGQDYNARVMLHGVVEHDAYHGGQIAILKRALARGGDLG